MIDPAFALLHVGPALELTLLEYLYRVLLHLLAVGGLAVLVLRLSELIGATRTARLPPREHETSEE